MSDGQLWSERRPSFGCLLNCLSRSLHSVRPSASPFLQRGDSDAPFSSAGRSWSAFQECQRRYLFLSHSSGKALQDLKRYASQRDILHLNHLRSSQVRSDWSTSRRVCGGSLALRGCSTLRGSFQCSKVSRWVPEIHRRHFVFATRTQCFFAFL